MTTLKFSLSNLQIIYPSGCSNSENEQKADFEKQQFVKKQFAITYFAKNILTP